MFNKHLVWPYVLEHKCTFTLYMFSDIWCYDVCHFNEQCCNPGKSDWFSSKYLTERIKFVFCSLPVGNPGVLFNSLSASAVLQPTKGCCG